jgi:hypothetical protein
MIVILRRPVIKQCPFKDELDAGELIITIPYAAPELHQFAAQIDAVTARPVSHEDFTTAVARLLPDAQIVTTWHTGPWSVEVREGALGDQVVREPDPQREAGHA